MKKKKYLLIFGLLGVAVIGIVILLSGILTVPSQSEMAKYKVVEEYNILESQFKREEEILADYQKGKYTPQKPYIIQDPYQANPLSALILFETSEPAQSSVTVGGKDQFSALTNSNNQFGTHHELPIIGLYPARQNRVSLTLNYQNGRTESVELSIQTEPLPYDFPKLTVEVSQPQKMEPGIILVTPCLDGNYTYLLDVHGEVRGYFSNRNFGHCTTMRVLKNGHLFTSGDVMKLMPYNMYTLWEMNLLGKVFVEYEIPNAVHHDIMELADGDFLATSNNANMPSGYDTREDVIIRIDRETGLVEREYDLRKILDENRKPYHHYDPDVENAPNRDWAHLNSVDYDPSDNSIIVSSPIQSSVVKFSAENSQIAWILSSPEGWDGEFSGFKKYQLKPVGENFEWQWGQHSARILPDGDGSPDTIDILLFDNGQAKSFTEANSIKPTDNYSRAVIFRIDEAAMTVEQIWQYGKERKSGAYSTFLGDADLLNKTGNISITFGGMLRKDGVPVDDIVAGVIGQQTLISRLIEVQLNGEVVFDGLVTPNQTMNAETYQMTRLDLGRMSAYELGKLRGQTKGVVQAISQTKYDLPKFFLPTLTFNFRQIFVKNEYLVMQGAFQYQSQTYLLGRVVFILKNDQKEYIFPSNSGINGNFQARIDLKNIQPGEYAIFAAGGVADGRDAKGQVKPGFNPTGFKIVIK